MSRYKRAGDLASLTYFRLSAEPGDQTWFQVRRQVEDYTEVEAVTTDGSPGRRSLIGHTAMVVPMAIAEEVSP